MKKGFTLLELLGVLAILAFLGVSSVILFGKNNEDITNEDLKNKYREIQQAAILYMDLNDSWLSNFTENGEAFIKLSVLQNENLISKKMVNPVNGDKFSSGDLVKVCIANRGSSNEFVDSCILSYESENNIKCIANRDGNPTNCCDSCNH